MDGTVSIVATYINKKLKTICKSGPRGRVPNLPEIERNKASTHSHCFSLSLSLPSHSLYSSTSLYSSSLAGLSSGNLPRLSFFPTWLLTELQNAPFSTTLFGVTLEEVMELTNEKFPRMRIPVVVKVLAEAVMRLGGFTTEGIFRVPGDTEQVFALRVQLDNGNYTVGDDIQDPNTPASLLKLWMRELAEPLVPTEF